MIKSVTIVNSFGEDITINLGEVEPEHGLSITGIEGLGPTKVDVHMSDLATQDGSIWNNSRASKRNIILHLQFIYANSIEDVRQLTYKYFPLKRKVTFHIETDNRIAEAYGYIESNEPDIFAQEETASISILCESPWWFDAGINGIQEMNFADIVSLFEFEFEDPDSESPTLEFSSIEIKRENHVEYRGEVETGIVMSMYATGPFTNPIIYNNLTREAFKIDTTKVASIVGSAVKAGDEIQISTVTNDKYIKLIRDGKEYNILNALDKDVDWLTMEPGENVFSYTADTGELNIMFKILAQVLYTGV